MSFKTQAPPDNKRVVWITFSDGSETTGRYYPPEKGRVGYWKHHLDHSRKVVSWREFK